jgi:hypothetical protein
MRIAKERESRMDTLEDKIETGRQKIQRLLESQTAPKKSPTKALIVLGLREDIAQMRTKGWSWDGIAEALKSEGVVDATAETIRLVYDGKSKKKSDKNANKKQKREKVATAVAPEKKPIETGKRVQERIEVAAVQARYTPPPRTLDNDSDEPFGPPES